MVSLAWSQVATLNSSKSSGVGFSHNGYGYVIDDGANTLEKYDPSSDSWTQVSTPSRSHGVDAQGFYTGRYFYLCGGYNNGRVDYVSKYDPENDSWSQAAPLRQARNGGACWYDSKNDRGYYACGYASNGTVDTVGKYDPENDFWTTATDCIESASGIAAFYDHVSDFAIVAGINGDDVLQYDASIDSWGQNSNVLDTDTDMGPYTCTLGDTGFVFNDLSVNTLNLNTSSWSTIPGPSVEVDKRKAGAFSINDSVYITGLLRSSDYKAMLTYKGTKVSPPSTPQNLTVTR